MLIKSTNLANARLMDFYQVMSLVDGFLKAADADALQLTATKKEFETSFGRLDASL